MSDGEPGRVDPTLRFYEEVLGLSFLHYGLWEGDPLNLEGLSAAQRRYADRLVSMIPEGTRSILDVGCGTGGNARLLTERGFEVEGLSPDPFQARRFHDRTGGLPFHQSRFETFAPPRAYDLVLMSESCQYVRITRLFDAVRRAAPGGWLLVADYFVYTCTDTPLGRSGHELAMFRRFAQSDGFTIHADIDITEAVLPTLTLARQWLDQRARPALVILEDGLRSRHPWLLALARWWFRDRLRAIAEQDQLVDVDAFRAAKSYRIFLISVPEGPSPSLPVVAGR